jgi:osmoprotectant transport system substrate-binding protein
MTGRWFRAARAAAVLTVVCALLAGCGGSGGEGSGGRDRSDEPITIGTKNFPEQFILGELYKQALEAKGFAVELKSDIGSSEIVDRALTSGSLDMYPEYIGVLLSEVAGDRKRPATAEAAYQRAKQFEERRGFTLLDMTPFSDSNALAVTPKVARARGMRSIGDLAKVPGGAEIGAPPEFRTRFEGLVGLREVYGLSDVRVKPLKIGDQYGALEKGQVDAALVFTTDGQLDKSGYRLLEDPRNLFAFQNVAPVVRQEVIDRDPRIALAIDEVSRLLTTGAMREMNAAVALRDEDPAEVASRFLEEKGLK